MEGYLDVSLHGELGDLDDAHSPKSSEARLLRILSSEYHTLHPKVNSSSRLPLTPRLHNISFWQQASPHALLAFHLSCGLPLMPRTLHP
jgi:hypothetical protein